LAFASLQTVAVESIPSKDAGAASGIISTSRYIGSIIGSIGVTHLLHLGGYPVGFWVFVMIVGAAGMSFLLSFGLRHQGVHA